ncbi:MAG TPA: hypothetical protein VEV19_05235 [Ktedonobacteraceae bacterium]|nr:hypothetical protein [Ktedonobacteraceae bacterium]
MKKHPQSPVGADLSQPTADLSARPRRADKSAPTLDVYNLKLTPIGRLLRSP